MGRSAPSFEISTTPSGIQIAYYDKAHRYKIGLAPRTPPGVAGQMIPLGAPLRWVPSVSGVLDALPKNLTGWGERLGVAGVLEVLATYPDQPAAEWTVDELLEAMRKLDVRWWQVREKAALQGTDVHEVFEQLSLGKPPRLGDFPLSKRGFIQAMCLFWAERKPKVRHAELMVASWEHQYAGRMDLLAELDDDESDGDEVIDLKTSKAIRDSHHFQTGGYRQGVNESGYGPCTSGRVLRVGKDGKYELVKSWVQPEQFLAIKGAYGAIKQFERETPKQDNAVRRAA